MAPFDRRPEGSLTFGGIARATREERQGAIEALQERLRAEELRSCSGELDRKRQAVQTETDRLDRRRSVPGPSRRRGLVPGTGSPHLPEAAARAETPAPRPSSAAPGSSRARAARQRRRGATRGRERPRGGARSCRAGAATAFRADSRAGRRGQAASARSPARRARDPSDRREEPRTLRPRTCRPARPRPGARSASCPSRPGR